MRASTIVVMIALLLAVVSILGCGKQTKIASVGDSQQDLGNGQQGLETDGQLEVDGEQINLDELEVNGEDATLDDLDSLENDLNLLG